MREKHTVSKRKPGRAKGTKNRFPGVVAAAKSFAIHYTYLESILKGEKPDSKGYAARYRALNDKNASLAKLAKMPQTP